MAGYDAFISYSHDADLDFAAVLRDGLQKFAKPWNRRRAIDVFLDQSSLGPSAELGKSLNQRIEDTRWLVLLMSERSAQSSWVGAEVAQWAAAKSKEQIVLVLTSGEVVWDNEAKDFDYERSTAVNERMRGIYTGQDSEPLFVDLRWAKEVAGGEANLSVDHARFRNDIATIAAPIHGKPKDEMEGEDVRQFRLAQRLRRLAITALAALTTVAVVAMVVALFMRAEAKREERFARSGELASEARAHAVVEPDLAALLALESIRVANTPDARGSLADVLAVPTRFLQRTNEHEEAVTAIAFGDETMIAATGDRGGTIRIWDVAADPREAPQASLSDLDELEIQIPCLASCLEDGRLHAEVKELFVSGPVDDLLLAAVDTTGNLFIVDLTNRAFLGSLEPPESFVNIALSADFGLLAGTTDDGLLNVYGLSEELEFSDRPLGSIVAAAAPSSEVEVDPAHSLSFGPDGISLVWAAGSTFYAWEWESGGLQTHDLDSEVSSIAVSSVGSVVAVGDETGRITLFDVRELELVSEVDPRPANPALDLAFRPTRDDDGDLALASAHSNGDIFLWTVFQEDSTEPFGFAEDILVGHKEETWSVAFAPDGRIASGSFDGEVLWWSDVPLSSLGEALGDSSGDNDVLGVAFADPGTFVALDRFGRVRVWSGGSSDESLLIPSGDDGESATAVDAAAGLVGVGFEDGSVEVIGPDRVSLEPNHDGEVDGVVLSDDGRWLLTVSTGASTSAVVWDVQSRSVLSRLALPDDFEPTSAIFAQDGDLWVGGQDGLDLPVVLALDRATGAVRDQLLHGDVPGNWVGALALSADEKTLVTGSSDRAIRSWDVGSLAPRDAAFVGHREAITGLLFADGDETLISSDQAGAVIMWDVEQRRQIAVLGGPTDGVNALDLNTNVLIAAGEDDHVWRWTLDPEEWRVRACALAGRNMTEAEWDKYGRGTLVQHCPQFASGPGAVVTSALTATATRAATVVPGATVAPTVSTTPAASVSSTVIATPAATTAPTLAAAPAAPIVPTVTATAVGPTALPTASVAVPNSYNLAIGDCFDLTSAVERLSCSTPHDYEVFSFVSHPGADDDPHPDSESFSTACAPGFADYIGVPQTESRFAFGAFTPPPDAWELGERALVCFAYDRDLAQIQGSVRGRGE